MWFYYKILSNLSPRFLIPETECNASISVYYDSAEDKDVRFLWFAYLYLGLFDAYMMFQIE